MKIAGIILAATCLMPAAALAQVTITGVEPVTGGTYTTPALASATATSPKGISGWDVYFGNTLVYRAYTGLNGQLDQTITSSSVTPGTYQVTITAFDNSGAYSSYVAQNVKVVASPLPSPGSNATTYSNLQEEMNGSTSWEGPCNGTCSGSAGGSGSSNQTFSNASPSLSGGSMGETSTGSSFNTLYYQHLTCPSNNCTAATNFVDDVWFYIPSSTNTLQALEFDPDVFTGTKKYFMSMQCDSASGDWRFWNTSAGGWTVKSSSGGPLPLYPCSVLTQTNQWHHYQLYGTMNFSTGQYTFQTLAVDGVTVFQNIGNTYNDTNYSTPGPNINIEQQIDNNSSAGINTVYYDNYNLTVW